MVVDLDPLLMMLFVFVLGVSTGLIMGKCCTCWSATGATTPEGALPPPCGVCTSIATPEPVEATPKPVETTPEPVQVDESFPEFVYLAKWSDVYHLTKTCSYLRNSQPVRAYPLCKACGRKHRKSA